MLGFGCKLMEINGDSGAVEEIHSLQGETIPPIQPKASRVVARDVLSP